MDHQVNIGKTEGRYRIGIGLLLIGIGGLTMLPEWGSALVFVLGSLMLFTGVRLFCPLWKCLGINTCQDHHHDHHSSVN